MAENVSVSVSGPALSFLLYENVKCPGNQVGFLLGAVMNHVTDTISDTHMTNETMETLINIHSVMPFFEPFPFYNGVGKIDRNKLKAFVKDREKEVVGWYCFRRSTQLTPHLRDRLLHKELCSVMTHLSPEVFTMCLLSSAVLKPAVGSTHSFSHKFFRYCHRSFKPLSVNIQNLGGTSQSEYKMIPSIACASSTFNNIVDSVMSSYSDSSPKNLMLHVQQTLQDHLRNLITDVEAVENEIVNIEKQISDLHAHVGPVPNEILLPQLLKQDSVATATIIDLQPTVCNDGTKPTSISTCDNSGKLITNQTETKKEPNYSVTPSKSKREPSPSSSCDSFTFTTEMKIDVGSPKSPVLISSNKPARGVGRGQRKKQVSAEPGGEQPEGIQTRRKQSRAQASPAKETIIPISLEESKPSDHGKSSPRGRSSPLQSSPPVNAQSPGKTQQSLPSSKKNLRASREGQNVDSPPTSKVAQTKGPGATSNRSPGQKTSSPEVVESPKQLEQGNVAYNSANENQLKELSPRVVLIPVDLETSSPRTRQRSQHLSKVGGTCSSPRTLAQVVSGSNRQD